MPNYKCTFIFTEWKQGWKELWYMTANTLQEALTIVTGNAAPAAGGNLAAPPAPGSIAFRRAGLLGAGARLVDVGISELGTRNAIHSYWGGATPGTPPVTDTPWNAILCTCIGLSGYKRKMTMRGVPDSWINMNALGQPAAFTAGSLGLFNQFVATVANPNGGGTFKIRAINKEVLTNPKVTITKIGPGANPAKQTLITAPGFLPIFLKYVRIKGVAGMNIPPGLNGVHQVFGPIVPGTSFTIYNPWVAGPPAPLYTKTGYVRNRDQLFDPIVNITMDRYSNRDTGAAPFVPRGRRKGKVC